MKNRSCVALIVAAGRGRRFGDGTPKQYLDLGGRPVLQHALATFAVHIGVDAVRVVIHAEDRELYDIAATGLNLLEPVTGGSTRQESVRLGLESLAASAYDTVLIHDGARPFVDAGTITRVINALAQSPGAIAALPVNDTLKMAVAGSVMRVASTVERTNLWQAQTPQGFHFSEILAAHRVATGNALTDDAAVAERAGLLVQLVEGSRDNVKITTVADLSHARRRYEYEAPATVRIGSGFDVHAFGVTGTAIWLCGIQIPHDRMLAGHSDADVALHALTDALLGAVAAGDIGLLFPDSDLQWRGRASSFFVRHAVSLVRALGGAVMAVDLTIFCELPKVGPYRLAMITRLAEILDIALERVSLKATTTEGLGFTGRREGIAAHATVTVLLKEEPYKS